MPRKIKTVATVETLPDNRGYAVHNARTSKVLDHVFTSRLEAFAFAQEIAAYGTRTATRRLIQRLAAQEELAAKQKRITTVTGHFDPDAPRIVSHFTMPPKREHATREEVIAAFGTAAYWQAELTRLTNRLARETDARKRAHLQLLIFNAEMQQGAAH